MALRIESQAEPIPGYRLIERLGRGGFGEVWKAEAPGGLLKAIKFVYGDLDSKESGGKGAEQELRALNRVKTVRHPYILSLERVDIISGQLIIVMELADRNLWDRFKEARATGQVGIPREELLRYMEEAAEALDLMNTEYQLQHLDIKPQNLFLVRNHVKVADFGLVKDFEGMWAAVTGGVTPVYAAPETFDGKVSRFCDQYSLAIVYQELLTGHRPFPGNNSRQLVLQHLQAAPNLAALPAQDRPIIAQALSKNPNDRHPSCESLVRALRAVSQLSPPNGATLSAASTPGNGTLSPPVNTPAMPVTPDALPELTGLMTPAGLAEPLVGPSVLVKAEPASPPPASAGVLSTIAPQTAGPSGATGQLGRTELRVAPETARPPSVPEEIQGPGVLRPSLIIGLGGTGLGVLQKLRSGLLDRYGSLGVLSTIRFLYLDADPEGAPELFPPQGRAALAAHETLLARLNRASYYLKPREGLTPIETWLDSQMLFRIPRNQVPSGLRPLGRLAFADNYRSIAQRLRLELEACLEPGALTAADRATRLGVATNRPRVYVIVNAGGGTGGGCFLDLAYLIRALLRRLGYERPDVVGLCVLPPIERKPTPRGSVALGNAFAALTELYHFSLAQTTYASCFSTKEIPLRDADAPLSRCVFVPTAPESTQEAFREAADLAAAYLYYQLISPLGRDLARPATSSGSSADFSWRTFGLYRISWPRRTIVWQAALRLAERLVDHWTNKNATRIQQEVTAHVDAQWVKHRLDHDGLALRLQQGATTALGQSPDDAISAALAPLERENLQTVTAATLTETFSRLEALLRPPPDELPEGAAMRLCIPPALDMATRQAIEEGKSAMHAMTIALMDDASFRLAGAEEAVRHLNTFVGQHILNQEAQAQELLKQAANVRMLVTGSLGGSQGFTGWWKRKSSNTPELISAVQEYAKLRYRALLLHAMNLVYRNLLSTTPEQVREVKFVRARLNDLRTILVEVRNNALRSSIPGPGRFLYPDGCTSIDEAVSAAVDAITTEELIDFDSGVQEYVRKQFTSMDDLCIHAHQRFREVAEAVARQAEAFVEALVSKASAAELYLASHPDEEEAAGDLAGLFDEAVPELAASIHGLDNPETDRLLVSADESGTRVGELAHRGMPELELLSVPGGEEVVLLREQTNLPLAQLAHLGPDARDAYEQMCAMDHFSPHARIDVAEWIGPVCR